MSQISESRFNRLEDKVTEASENVIKLNSNVIHLNEKFEEHIELVQEHIIGDNKIVDQLVNIIPDLGKMVERHKVDIAIKEERRKSWDKKVKIVTDLTKFIGLPSAILGLIVYVTKVL